MIFSGFWFPVSALRFQVSSLATSQSLRHHSTVHDFALLRPWRPRRPLPSLLTFPSFYPVNSVNPVQNKKPPVTSNSPLLLASAAHQIP